MDQFLHLATLSFKGESDLKKADLWIMEIEKKFKVMRYPEEEKVNLSTYMFQGHAEYWWWALQCTRFVDQEGPILWEEFFKIFRIKYFSDHVQEQKEREFAKLV